MGFFTMGFLIGRSGRQKETIYIENGDKDMEYYEEKKNPPTIEKTFNDPFYPKDGIRSIDEPSGVIMRPTAQELNQMNEDDATKQAKQEVAKAFKNEEPIDL